MTQRKPIKGFKGYEIDTDGNVYSYWKRSSKGWVISKELTKMNPTTRKYGYLQVDLRGDKRCVMTVYAIVLNTFVGKCPKGMQCRHLDGNPANNKLENLKWGTSKENHADRIRHGHTNKGEKHPFVKLNEVQVKVIRSIKTIPNHISSRKIGEIFNISSSTVRNILNNYTWKHI